MAAVQAADGAALSTLDHADAPTSQFNDLNLDGSPSSNIPDNQLKQSAKHDELDDFGEFSGYNSKDTTLPPHPSDHGSHLPASTEDHHDSSPEMPHRPMNFTEYDSDDDERPRPSTSRTRSTSQSYDLNDPYSQDDHDENLIAGQPKRNRLSATDPSVDPDAKPTMVFAIPFPETCVFCENLA